MTAPRAEAFDHLTHNLTHRLPMPDGATGLRVIVLHDRPKARTRVRVVVTGEPVAGVTPELWAGHMRMGLLAWRHVVLPSLHAFAKSVRLSCDVIVQTRDTPEA